MLENFTFLYFFRICFVQIFHEKISAKLGLNPTNLKYQTKVSCPELYFCRVNVLAIKLKFSLKSLVVFPTIMYQISVSIFPIRLTSDIKPSSILAPISFRLWRPFHFLCKHSVYIHGSASMKVGSKLQVYIVHSVSLSSVINYTIH